MTRSFVLLVIYALAVWRLCRLFVADTIMTWFRDWLGRQAHIGKVLAGGDPSRADYFWRGVWQLFGCYWCLSIWMSGLVTLLAYFEGSWWSWVCAALALSSVTGYLSERL